jgi:catechol 2,3-dioxygenase-like lactoylglutathione lyase family enzyme
MLIATTLFGLAWSRLKTWRPAQRALPSERAIVLTFAGALSLTLAVLATRAAAAAPINTNGTTYAIGGYDPVAYFEQSAAVRGKPEHAAQYAGATWLFADDAHRKLFQQEPAHYAPAFGGHCAYAAAQKRLVTIDPNAWSIVQGRLYLNYSLDIRRKWDAERAKFIQAADAFWSTLTGPRAEVRSIGLTVADLAAAERFFIDVLGFEREGARAVLQGTDFAGLVGMPGARATRVRLKLGREHVELVDYDAEGRAAPVDSRSDDLWFQHLALVTGDIDALHAKLQAFATRPISDGVQTIPSSNPAAGGIRAFYFRGPEAHPLELIWYPRDKGAARWHSPRAAVLGIDHTAIAVSNSERSRAFYQDGLGLTLAGRSFNQGREQERLSAVPGARVNITGLRGAEGPGVEFLEYAAPSGGRALPGDTQASDLWYSEITIAVSDLERTVAKLRAAGAHFVSDHIRDTRELVPGSQRGVLVRDPDGHAVRIVQ